MHRRGFLSARGDAWPQAFFTGAGAPPPARDLRRCIAAGSCRPAATHGRRRFSLALGPDPQRETYVDASPRVPVGPRRRMAAGIFHWRWGPTPSARLTQMHRRGFLSARGDAWPQALFTGAGARPPARDLRRCIAAGSCRPAATHGRRRFSLALGPHPQRETYADASPRVPVGPRRRMAAGAFHWRWGPTPSARLTQMHRHGFL